MQINQEQVQENIPQQRVRIFLQDVLVFELELSQCECLGELRHVLLQNPWVSLHPNFNMTLDGQVLQEFDNLAQQVSLNKNNLDIKLMQSMFTNQTGRQHIYTLAKFFEDPEEYLANGFLEFNILQGKTDFIQQSINQQTLTMQDVSMDKCMDHDLNLLSKISFLEKKNLHKNLFFKELSYAKYNPPQRQQVMNGDLFYMKLVTNEGKEVYLTVNKSGCYINKSTNEKFDSTTNSQSYQSLLDLIQVMSQDFSNTLEMYYNPSDQYLYKRWSDELKITQQKNNNWVKNFNKVEQRTLYLQNLQEIFKNEFAGQNLSQYRDWNEEFFNQKLISRTDTMQAIQKMQLMHKIQTDFLGAAKKLAKAVVNEDIQSVNLTDKKFEKCFVFNNLFATFAIDSLDWELPKSESTPSTYSAVNNDIMNLRYLNSLENERINSINTCTVDYLGNRIIIQTVIQGILHFDQKTWNCYGSIDDGKTMNWNTDFHVLMEEVCDHFKLTKNSKFKDESGKEYTFHGSPEVKGITAGDNRKYVMDLMRLTPRDSNYNDPQKHECCVLRPELIKSFFYVQEQENNLKQLAEYQKKVTEQNKLNQEKIQQKKLEDENKKKDNQPQDKQAQEVPQKKDNEQQDTQAQEVPQKKDNEQQDKQVQDVPQKKDVKQQDTQVQDVPEQKDNQPQDRQVQEVQQQNDVKQQDKQLKEASQKKDNEKQDKEQTKIKSFDPSILTTIESTDNKEQKLKDIEKISKFLKEKIINVFLENATNNPLAMVLDNETLVDVLHGNGINIRYLGYINQQSNNKFKNYYLTKLTERVIFVRSFNKFLREVAVSESKENFLNIFVYFMNLMFGSQQLRNRLNKDETKLQSQVSKNENSKKSKKKRKKNKNKKNQQEQQQVDSKYMKYNSNQIYIEIKKIGKERYGYEFKSELLQDLDFIQSDQEKVTIIREIARKIGISFIPKKYYFHSANAPFSISDISDIHYHIKFAESNSDYLKFNYKQVDNDMMSQNYEQAYQLLKASQQMIINTQGIYNEDFITNLTRLSNFFLLTKKIDEAVKTQIFALKISEQVLGIDHPKTALCILELSNYLYEQRKIKQAINLHKTALYLFDLISSPYNPNSLFCLHELQILSEDQKDKEQSMQIIKILLERHEKIFGETDERLLYFLSKLAMKQAEIGDFQQASLLQARHYLILKRLSQNPVINNMYKGDIQRKLNESATLRDVYMKKRSS